MSLRSLYIRKVAVGSFLLAVGCVGGEQSFPGDPPPLSARIEARMGGSDLADAHGNFSDISGIAIDSLQRVIVSDAATNTITVFSRDGVYLFSVVQPLTGEHPLGAPCCVNIGPDGRLWVSERSNQRYSSYRLVGDSAVFVGSLPTRFSSSGRLTRVEWDSAGHLIHLWDVLAQPDSQFYVVRSLLGTDGQIIGQDTIPNPPAGAVPTAHIVAADGSGMTDVPQPFGPRWLMGIGRYGELVSAVSSNYYVSWFDSQRKLVRRLTRNLEGPTVSRRERRHAEDDLVRLAATAGIPRSLLPFSIPDRKAVLSSLGFDLGGRVWVERSVPDGADRAADVYDTTGRRVALMKWPQTLSLDFLTVRGVDGFGVVRDSDGSEHVALVHFQ